MFIKKYSHVITLLTDIIRKKQEFYWDKKAQKAFKEFKQLFTEKSILQMFNSQWPTVIKADVSDY